MEILKKDEVLEREELIFTGSESLKNVRIQGEWGNNFFWHGDKCYIPVIYQGKIFKKRIKFKPIYE